MRGPIHIGCLTVFSNGNTIWMIFSLWAAGNRMPGEFRLYLGNLPLSGTITLSEIIGPLSVLIFLGIILDTVGQQIGLLPPKLQELMTLVQDREKRVH